MSTADHSRFWRDPAAPGVEFFAASFTRYAFARHAHDESLVGVVEQGVEAFTCRGTRWLATPDDLITVNPGDIHDGTAATPAGFRYRVLYIDPPVLAEILREAAGLEGTDRAVVPFYRRSLTPDAEMAAALRRVLAAFDPDAPPPPGLRLQRQTALLGVVGTIFSRHAGVRARSATTSDAPLQVRRAMAWMAENLEADVGLEDLAAVAGLSRFQLVRAFRRATGFPPHAYLMQRRMAAAKALLRAGEPPAGVAAAVGLYDQAHFTRRFKQAYGITPGAYQAGVRIRH